MCGYKHTVSVFETANQLIFSPEARNRVAPTIILCSLYRCICIPNDKIKLNGHVLFVQ